MRGIDWKQRLSLLTEGSPLGAPEVTVSAEVANVVTVSMQLKTLGDVDLIRQGVVWGYLSDDALGNSLAATAPSGGWAIGTDGVILDLIAGKFAIFISEDNGKLDFEVTETGTGEWYFISLLPHGFIVPSDPLTFTA